MKYARNGGFCPVSSLLSLRQYDKLVLLFDKALLHGEPFGGAFGIYARIAGGFLPSFGQLAKACWSLLLVCEAHDFISVGLRQQCAQ